MTSHWPSQKVCHPPAFLAQALGRSVSLIPFIQDSVCDFSSWRLAVPSPCLRPEPSPPPGQDLLGERPPDDPPPPACPSSEKLRILYSGPLSSAH